MQVTLRINWIYVRRRVINTLTKNTPTQKGDHHEEQFRTGVRKRRGNQSRIQHRKGDRKRNKAEIEKAKADMRSLNEEIGAKGDAYAFVYRLYQEMKEAGNEHIDLHDTIRDEAKMIETLRNLGVESFTFSSGWSSAVESAWIFQENGCRLQGLIELNSPHMNWFTGTREKVHGYLFSIQ